MRDFRVCLHSVCTASSTELDGSFGSELPSLPFTSLTTADIADCLCPAMVESVEASGRPRGCAFAVARLSNVSAEGTRKDRAVLGTVNRRAWLVWVPPEFVTCTRQL